MFTIRVDHGRSDAGRPARSVFACDSYAITFGQSAATIAISGEDGKSPKDVIVIDGEIAYVMNAAGTTVDVVDLRRRRAAG